MTQPLATFTPVPLTTSDLTARVCYDYAYGYQRSLSARIVWLQREAMNEHILLCVARSGVRGSDGLAEIGDIRLELTPALELPESALWFDSPRDFGPRQGLFFPVVFKTDFGTSWGSPKLASEVARAVGLSRQEMKLLCFDGQRG